MYLMVRVVFYTVGEPFRALETKDFKTESDARIAAEQFGKDNGFTAIKFVSDEDFCLRVTGTTPNGRAGRNLASIEFGWDEE